MSTLMIDILILLTSVLVWAGLCMIYEGWTDPRNRRKRQRRSRRKALRRELEKQGRILR